MKKVENLLDKWNFKKIAITYLIVAIIAGIISIGVAAYVYREKLNFVLQYAKTSEYSEKKDTAMLETQIKKLADSSLDVVDVLVLDNNSNVVFSAKDSRFAKDKFVVTKDKEEDGFLVCGTSPDVVFKYVKGEDLMQNSVFNTDFGEIKKEYDDNNFFKDGYASKTVYMLNYIGEKDTESRIYVISNPSTVANGMLTLKVIASVAMLFFMIYWVLLALWVYQNSSKSKLYPVFWGIIVLLTNIAGLVVYLIYKNGSVTCPNCKALQSKNYSFCTYCGNKLGDNCNNCGAHLAKNNNYCPRCGNKVK